MALKKSSELRQQEHVNSTQYSTTFDGTLDTCPWRVGDLYDGREIISIGFTKNVYGEYYHLIVERGRAHTRMKFEFDFVFQEVKSFWCCESLTVIRNII